MKNKTAIFTRWLWSKRNQNLVFFPGVFLDSNTDQSLPRPALSIFEAQGLFYLLEERKLVYPQEVNKQTAYCLNEIKESEWEEFIAEYEKPAWRRSKVVGQIGKGVLWMLAAFLGGFLGAIAKKTGEDIYDHRDAAQSPAVAPAKAPNKAPEPTPTAVTPPAKETKAK